MGMKSILRRRACIAIFGGLFLSFLTMPVAAQVITPSTGAFQVDAFLPNKADVEEEEPSAIDGVWKISTIGKKIRIERGRAFAVDSWLHMFVLKVQPDMVVLQNLHRTGVGRYKADDLPLLGPATFELGADGNLSVSVKSVLGPVSYRLIKRELDDPAAFEAEVAAVNGDPVQPLPNTTPDNNDAVPNETVPLDKPDTGETYAQDTPLSTSPDPNETISSETPPVEVNPLANCKNLDVDQTTGEFVCKD
jgi:hypothetical protein